MELDYLRRSLDFQFGVLDLGRQFELKKVNSDLNVWGINKHLILWGL